MSVISEIPPIEITSVGDLVTYVADLSGDQNRIYWFRGHRKAEWEVLPGIWRNYDTAAEQSFTNRFRTRATLRRPSAPEPDDYSAWLSLMQHYGLPTRLLDWSRSPLIAAYFAVASYSKADAADAVVWMLDPHRMNEILSGNPQTFPIDSEDARKMLKPAFKGREDDADVLAVMAVEYDMRMFVQQGAFTVHDAKDALNTRKGHARYLRPLLIPASAVRAVARQIYASGFRHGDLCPDLSNLADELTGKP